MILIDIIFLIYSQKEREKEIVIICIKFSHEIQKIKNECLI